MSRGAEFPSTFWGRWMSTNASASDEDRIGPYKVVRVVSNGIASSLIEAIQESTGKRFAIKQLLPSNANDRSIRKALQYEAKLGAELRHPNLVRVHEYVNDPDQPYIVMDFFPSQHMRLCLARPKEYPPPKSQMHRIISQSAQAIAYLHDHGYVHRDIKPENILYNKSGEVRLIDYGMTLKIPTGFGKLFASKPPRQGTHAYIAPEQINREPLAIGVDIYSFGVTIYELASGKKPFAADSLTELLSKHLKAKPVPPTMHNPNITKEFSELTLQMLAKKPGDRPATMRDFLSRFGRIRIYQDDPAPQTEF